MARLFIYTLILILLNTSRAEAQTVWPSPEVEQMYNDARQSLSNGNFKQAIITYQQAIQLAPTQLVLYRDLGHAYYLTGNYEDAKKILEPVLESGEADDQSFQIMSSSLLKKGDKKKAKATLQKGIERFPHSGLLYHEMGLLYEDQNELVYALETWLDGIQADPAYHLNYYEAARSYVNTKKPVWAIIYGEIFVNIEQHTPRADETRNMVINAYKTFFNNIGTTEIPKFGKAKISTTVTSFEDAVSAVLLKLSPVVGDGFGTENLTMLRTRFLIEWYALYVNQYPFTLFSRQDGMLRDGMFDIYNEWLFGKIDNPQLYDAWNKFHQGDMDRFEMWLLKHPLQPVAGDFYNDKQVDGIFIKNKK